MKAHYQLQAQMRDAYERFQRSNLSQQAFCQVEGISKGKFNYWCRQFKQTPTLLRKRPIHTVFVCRTKYNTLLIVSKDGSDRILTMYPSE